jgi:hypothetical protein
MELQQRGLCTLEIISENSKNTFIRSIDYNSIPSCLYFDKVIPYSELPASIYYRTITSLKHLSTEGAKVLETAFNEGQAVKCFDDTGEMIFFVYFSAEPNLQSFVLARFHFSELCLDPVSFTSELRRLAQDRVKDIRFKNTIKDCFGYYKACFDQWVETVQTQQKEIQKLQDEISEIRLKEEKQEEIESDQVARCVLCEKEQRNVVFVPCGHVIICTFCLANKLKLPLNVQASKKVIKCVACKRSVKIAHEVYF